jgi:polysaccharide biosynthesis protein PslH
MINRQPRILFLALDSPLPAYSGASLRSLGLLKELGKRFAVELIVLNPEALSAEQTGELQKYACTIKYVPLKDASRLDKALAAMFSLTRRIPYHSAVLERSLQNYPELSRKIQQYRGLVFTSIGHWGCLVRHQTAKNWILNQCDADVEFWSVYANRTSHLFMRLASWINYYFSRRMYPAIYANVGRVISICEEDKLLTLALASTAYVEVIENGVDCETFAPQRVEHVSPPRLLFTGTSVERNMVALRRFAANVLPMISAKIPEVELLVAGRFSGRAQSEFQAFPNIKFTGPVPDIRPFFNQSDVFVAPFEETLGSKVKIVEAMSMGMPIVSTPQGIRGVPLVDGQSVRIAHDNNQFACHVIELLENPSAARELGLAARALAENVLDWSQVGRRLEKIMVDVQKEIA